MPAAHLRRRTDLLLATLLMPLFFLTHTLSLFFSRSHTLLWLFVVHFLSVSLSFSVASISLLKCNSEEQKAWEETQTEKQRDKKKAEIVVLKKAGNPVRFIHWYLMNHVIRKCLRAALTVRCIIGSYTEVILLWEMIHDH